MNIEKRYNWAERHRYSVIPRVHRIANTILTLKQFKNASKPVLKAVLVYAEANTPEDISNALEKLKDIVLKAGKFLSENRTGFERYMTKTGKIKKYVIEASTVALDIAAAIDSYNADNG